MKSVKWTRCWRCFGPLPKPCPAKFVKASACYNCQHDREWDGDIPVLTNMTDEEALADARKDRGP